MAIQFASQGKMRGASLKTSRKGTIDVFEYYHEIISPRDAATGQATGKRTHKPVCVGFYYEACVPQLYQALARNESATTVQIDFYSPNNLGKSGGQGQEVLHYTVKLYNAFISRITHTGPNNRVAELKGIENTIKVEWVYEKVEWTWLVGGNKMAYDDWKDAK
jgi:type VI secretion system secreted protein Hcp